MKIDIAEFLRGEGACAGLGGMPLRAAKFEKAADEIERLRSLVQMLTHESPHALGIPHETTDESLMYPAKKCGPQPQRGE